MIGQTSKDRGLWMGIPDINIEAMKLAKKYNMECI